jgi:hypothetical protein
MDYNGLYWGFHGCPMDWEKNNNVFFLEIPMDCDIPQDIGEIPERIINQHWLVVLTPLKNMKGNGKDYPIYDGK